MLESQVSTATDRRSAPRQMVAYRLDVLPPEGPAAFLLDVSTAGMRVRFKGSTDLGRIERLTVALPRWLELGERLEMRGRFVWVRNLAGGSQEAGFAFDGLSRKESNLLEVLIQRLAGAVAEDRPTP